MDGLVPHVSVNDSSYIKQRVPNGRSVMSKRSEKCAATARARAEAELRFAKVRAIVATGKCSECGSGLRRNLSLKGWWQCEQLGAPAFRARPEQPPCSWQAFTE